MELDFESRLYSPETAAKGSRLLIVDCCAGGWTLRLEVPRCRTSQTSDNEMKRGRAASPVRYLERGAFTPSHLHPNPPFYVAWRDAIPKRSCDASGVIEAYVGPGEGGGGE